MGANICSMGIAGSGIPPYAIFRQALDAGNLQRCLNIAKQTPNVSLLDALRIVELMAREDDERFERAAVKWAGRLATERGGVPRATFDRALRLLDRLPDQPELIEEIRQLIGATSCRTV